MTTHMIVKLVVFSAVIAFGIGVSVGWFFAWYLAITDVQRRLGKAYSLGNYCRDVIREMRGD